MSDPQDYTRAWNREERIIAAVVLSAIGAATILVTVFAHEGVSICG